VSIVGGPILAEVLSRLFFAGFVRTHAPYHAARGPVCGEGVVPGLGRHAYRLSPGTVYPVLHELERVGCLTGSAAVVSGKRRKYYEATAGGR
jgi:PadR family transcriptional regulator, regulatory protein PadR